MTGLHSNFIHDGLSYLQVLSQTFRSFQWEITYLSIKATKDIKNILFTYEKVCQFYTQIEQFYKIKSNQFKMFR